MANKATVFIVEDDEQVRESLRRLVEALGYRTRCFPSAEAFLQAHGTGVHGCLLLDVQLPGSSGFDLQTITAQHERALPIIFLTAFAEVEAGVQAMRNGAVVYLRKPVRREVLQSALRDALLLDRTARRLHLEYLQLWRLFRQLTRRESQVLELVVKGRLNKQIAFDLDIAERTVKLHRARAMEKIGAATLADAIHINQTYVRLAREQVNKGAVLHQRAT